MYLPSEIIVSWLRYRWWQWIEVTGKVFAVKVAVFIAIDMEEYLKRKLPRANVLKCALKLFPMRNTAINIQKYVSMYELELCWRSPYN
jgi:hypothetical protein